MKNLLLSMSVMCTCGVKAQQVKLSGEFNREKNVVELNWNMVAASSKTGFVLLRSKDGSEWTEAAKDRIVRNYSDDDQYSFDDKFYTLGKNLYRLKIFDAANNTVALSPIITVNTSVTSSTFPSSGASNNSSWILYPNPVQDVLTLSYKGKENIPGVVSVQVVDETGKVRIKFRSASVNTTIQIPVTNLRHGIYVVQLSVLNDILMNQKFVKQ